MSRYKFTKKAVDDLTQIWNYTRGKWSEKQADAYYLMLLENCKKIASNPELGKNYVAIMENLLGFKAGRHIIFFRKIEKNEIEILRILHERMDIKNRIDEK